MPLTGLSLLTQPTLALTTSGAVTDAATTLCAAKPHRVLGRVFVAAEAVCPSRGLCRRPHAAERIGAGRYRLKMGGIETTPIPAEMVNPEANWNRADRDLESDTVGILAGASLPAIAIAVGHDEARPIPTFLGSVSETGEQRNHLRPRHDTAYPVIGQSFCATVPVNVRAGCQ